MYFWTPGSGVLHTHTDRAVSSSRTDGRHLVVMDRRTRSRNADSRVYRLATVWVLVIAIRAHRREKQRAKEIQQEAGAPIPVHLEETEYHRQAQALSYSRRNPMSELDSGTLSSPELHGHSKSCRPNGELPAPVLQTFYPRR